MVHRVSVPFGYEPFREVARRLLQADLPPAEVHLTAAADDEGLLVGADDGLPSPPETAPPITVPLSFVRRLSRVLCHRDRERLNLGYRLLWRVVHGERRILADPAHADVQWFLRLEQQVTQDVHHFVAVARFSPMPGPPRPGLLAYHRPRWRTTRLAAPRFVTRFRGRPFALLTPDESALWDGAELSFGPGFGALPDHRELGPRWQAFYGQHADTFGGLPEPGDLVSLREAAPWPRPPAGGRVADVPDTVDLARLAFTASRCEQCPRATGEGQTVFGQGPVGAAVMLVGGAPEAEDSRSGTPFVGPAGQALERVLSAAGLQRDVVYLTFAVKHRGAGRVRPEEVRACRPWLESEIRAVRPQAVVALGPVAGVALLGPAARDPARHGQVIGRRDGRKLVITHAAEELLKKGRAAILFDRMTHDVRKAVAAARMRE